MTCSQAMNAIPDPAMPGAPSEPTIPPHPAPGLTYSLAGSVPARGLVNAGFQLHSRLRTAALREQDPRAVQRSCLRRLLATARDTRFGRDHGFAGLRDVEDFQKAVPLRTYESLWDDYLKAAYPVFEDLTWPGRIPYLALTSGTTQGATKYIPVSREMVASNRKAAQTMVAAHLAARPRSRLFFGRLFFLGGTTALEEPAPGVRQGDLSGVAAIEVSPLLRPYTFPPLELALESNWDRKLALLAERSLGERISLISGVPSWLLMLFQRLLELSGKSTIGEVWPDLEVVVHGGVKFDPYERAFRDLLGRDDIRLQETYPCSEGFIAYGDPASGLLRMVLDHGLFYEFVPVDELESPSPTRHWIGDVQTGVNYAIVVSTCAGMWAHIIGDTVRFESLDPPLIRFTGRTKYSLSAFGEHLINEEVESALAEASELTGAQVRDWHVGPVFRGALGYHQYVVEFFRDPADPRAFRDRLDRALSARNADYQAHRAEGVGLPLPALLVASPGTFAEWMRIRGKLGGQNKVPRMDGTGTLTADLAVFVRESGRVLREINPS
ncbi:MAG: GH3 auxin-responsive promoter family protein [Isosphaeraceae bacterium]